MKKKVLFGSLLFVLVLLLSGCGNKAKIENCKDCVFARYNESKKYGDRIITDYTDNYKNLKGNKIFLGHKLNNNKRIVTGYVCAIENKKAFCIEGKSDSKTYEKNKKVLYNVYGKDKCKEDKIGDANAMTCSGDLQVSIYDNTILIAESKSNQCVIMNENMYCYDSSNLK